MHCYGCNQLGHIVKKCLEKKERRTHKPAAKGCRKWKRKKKQGGIHNLDELETEEGDKEGAKTENFEDKVVWPIFTIADSCGSCKEMMVHVLIEGKPLDMELDTGALDSIIPKSVWCDVLAAKPLQKTCVLLPSYSGHEIRVVGEAKVQVSYCSQQPMVQY